MTDDLAFIQRYYAKLEREEERLQLKQEQLQRQQAAKRKRAAKCGAFARSTGKPCQRKPLANGRCRNHGGLSTGPKTQDGKARAMANLKQFQKVAFRSCEGQST